MATAADVINRARHIINDEASSFVSGLRWSDTEMCRWVTDAQRTAVDLKPESNPVTALHTVTAGPRQRMSASAAVKVIRVEANGTSGPTYGKPVRFVEKDVLDSYSQDWMSNSPTSAADRYKSFALDDNDPLAFWLFPIGVSGRDVIVTYAGLPAAVSATTDTLTLADNMVPVLVDYVVYRALFKESRAGAKDVAQSHYERFLAALGAQRQIVKSIGANANRPPDGAA